VPGRFALIVASSRYTDPRLARLEAPTHDAEALAAVLAKPGIGGFEVATVVDGEAPHVMQRIEEFCDGRARDDLLLLAFSGHGILDERARLYFATADTRVDRPRSTAVPAQFVHDVMEECRSRSQVLVLDCCNSGAFGRGVKAGGAIGTGSRFEGRGRIVITASDALQFAFEGDRIEGEPVHSVFTGVLVEGLRSGEADRDGDGWITLDELYDYAFEQVVEASPRQRPRKWAFDVEGRLVVARSARAHGEPPAAPPRALPGPPAEQEPPPRRRLARRRAAALLAGLVLLLAAAAAAVALVALRGGGGGDNQDLAEGVNSSLQVFEAWSAGRLDEVGESELSATARNALETLPPEPILPLPPGPDDCWGEPDDVSCPFYYTGLDLYLRFDVLEYSTGLRVATVECVSSTGAGRLEDCARTIRES
jgi:Caspase domain